MQINQQTPRSQALQLLMAATAAEPHKVLVVEHDFHDSVEFYVTCSDRDYGKLIGKSGINVQAWSLIGNAASQKDLQKPSTVIVKTPDVKNAHPPERFELNPRFTDKTVQEILTKLSELVFERGVVEVFPVDSTLIAAKVTAYGFFSHTIDTQKFEDAVGIVTRAIGGANGRRLKVELLMRTD